MATAPAADSADPSAPNAPLPGASLSLVVLLLINLFNYVDRQVLAAVEPAIQKQFGVSQADMGWAATAFLLSYMVVSPVFGLLADRMSRWVLVGVGVILWSLASGATGLAGKAAIFSLAPFTILLVTRCFVGVGEAAYGPVAPTILSDFYPVNRRGRILSWFYVAIPVGSALGYVLGGQMLSFAEKRGWPDPWRWAFYAVVPPGILLGLWSLFMRDPKRGAADRTQPAPAPANGAPPAGPPQRKAALRDLRVLLHTPSYVLNTLGMAGMTFAIGGIGFWMPHYIVEFRHHSNLKDVNSLFGVIVVVSGLIATIAGGMAGDALRKRFAGSYFLVSAAGLLLGFPLTLGILYAPFPWAWVMIFLAVFCLFFNTGPTNTILANVTHPAIRASAFAINIFVIHLLGDAVSPPLIGWVADKTNMNVAFGVVSAAMLVGGLLWLWGARYLAEDTAKAPQRFGDAGGRGFDVVTPH